MIKKTTLYGELGKLHEIRPNSSNLRVLESNIAQIRKEVECNPHTLQSSHLNNC